MAIPGNFLSAVAESVDPDISGWLASLNCAASLGSGGRNGDGVLTLTSAASGEMQARTWATYRVTAGTVYQAFADAASANQPERIGIQWLTSTNAVVGTTTWSLTTNAASAAWHRISVAGSAPFGATRARVILSATTTASAKTHFFENVYLGPPIRTSGNLLSFNAESGGDLDATAWAADVNCTVGRDAPAVTWPVDWYLSGGEVVKATTTANGNMAVKCAESPAVTEELEYLGYLYINPPTSGAACWVEIRWYDNTGTLISAKRANLAQPGTGWYRQIVSGIAPVGAATAALAAGITSATAAQVLRVEGAAVVVAVPLTPGSVMPYEDSSFEQGVGQWTVASGVATIARSTPWGAAAFDEGYALTVVSSTATTSVLASGKYPITPGLSWRGQIQAKSPAGTWQIAPQLRFYDAGGASISVSTLGPDAVPANGDWWRVWNDVTTPSNAATARIEVGVTAPTTSATLEIDAAVLLQTQPSFTAVADDGLGLVTLVLRELTAGDLLTVYRVVGGTQSLVRGPDGLLNAWPASSDTVTFEDYEAPLNQAVSYRRETHSPTTGALIGTGDSPTVTLMVPDPSDCWIKDPLQPQRNILLSAALAPDWTRPIEQTEYRIRGRRNSVVLSDVRGGLTGTLQVWTTTDAERQALHFALALGTTLLFQFTPGLGLDDMYAAVGDAGEPRFIPYGGEPRRMWQLPLTEQDSPPGGVGGSAGWTVQDVVTTWATVADVAVAYATVLDLVLDNREA